MRFTHPAYLVLLIPVVLGLVLSFKHVKGMMRLRKRLAFALRFVLLASLVLALAGPEALRKNHGLCTIFVLDRSDSVSEPDYARAKTFIEDSLKRFGRDDDAGLIVFGKEPVVERTPGQWRQLGPIQSVVQASASDVGAAIRLACASFPEGKARRIVLLSDGDETTGDAAGAAMAAAADGIAIDHLALGLKPREGEVSVLSATLPSEARVDQPFDVSVLVDASRPTTGTLVLDRDGTIVKTQRVRLNAGRNSVVVNQVLSDPGFHRYRATVTAEGDRDTRNNVGMGFVSVRGRPKVLILQQTASPSPLSQALAKQGIVTEVYGPEGVASRPDQLQAYDAVLREFEHRCLTFELVISASGFAQLKRHRVMTITAQPYNPTFGWTIPTSIAEIKEHKTFKEMLARTEEVFDRIAAVKPSAAQYVLTNSHQRRVLVSVDARELYHISRLREDPAAQWDIRDIAGRMMEQARHVMPLTLALACGKDSYAKVYEDLFGKPPAVTELKLPEARPLPVEAEPKPRKRPKNPDGNSPPRHKDTKTGPEGNAPRPLGGPGDLGGSDSGKKAWPKKSRKG